MTLRAPPNRPVNASNAIANTRAINQFAIANNVAAPVNANRPMNMRQNARGNANRLLNTARPNAGNSNRPPNARTGATSNNNQKNTPRANNGPINNTGGTNFRANNGGTNNSAIRSPTSTNNLPTPMALNRSSGSYSNGNKSNNSSPAAAMAIPRLGEVTIYLGDVRLRNTTGKAGVTIPKTIAAVARMSSGKFRDGNGSARVGGKIGDSQAAFVLLWQLYRIHSGKTEKVRNFFRALRTKAGTPKSISYKDACIKVTVSYKRPPAAMKRH